MEICRLRFPIGRLSSSLYVSDDIPAPSLYLLALVRHSQICCEYEIIRECFWPTQPLGSFAITRLPPQLLRYVTFGIISFLAPKYFVFFSDTVTVQPDLTRFASPP